MNYLSPDQIKTAFEKQQAFKKNLSTTDYKTRIEKIKKISTWIKDPKNTNRIIRSVYADMKRPEVEIIGGEITTVHLTAKVLVKNLKNWLKPKKIPTPISLFGYKSYIYYESKGNTLIISPWNYPFSLAISPLLYAIAGGNTAIIKPSEYSQHTSQLLKDMIAELFDEKEVMVIQGEVEETTVLLDQPFNHIFFTGSPSVGKIIMKAAAKHLTSVTLELGGKSPCIVESDADLDNAAHNVLWGKFFNASQTCIAPDYLMVHESIKDRFISKLIEVLKHRYGTTIEEQRSSKNIGRIISDRHFNRTKSLLEDALEKGAKLLFGGNYYKENRFFGPTLLENIPSDAKVMQEEIFSPIFPIIIFKTKDQVVNQINSLPKPLALYIFSSSKVKAEYYLKNTTAGGCMVNNTLLQFTNENLPFGGVNNSGIGKSHGKHGLLAFMNEKSVMKQFLNTTKALQPPYSSRTKKVLKFFTKL